MDHKEFYEKRKDPVHKSIVRHGLKQIDKKWKGRDIKLKVASKIK